MQKRSVRWDERTFVVEGAELLRLAINAGLPVESVYLSPEGAENADAQSAAQLAITAGARHFALAPGVLERVADTVTPQPVLAIVPMRDHDRTAVLDSAPDPGSLLLVMVDVRDPGNAGTVLRTADAAGVRAVIFSGDSVDPYNPKTVRSSAGSLFHVPFFIEHDAVALAASLQRTGYRTFATGAGDGQDYAAVDWRQPAAVFLGNEAGGLSSEVRQAAEHDLAIPMEGKSESLNVGVASAVVSFEALRQRRTA